MRAKARGVAAVGHHAAVRSSRFSVLLCEHGPQRPHRLLETWLRRCASCVVFEARLSFAFVPVRHRNHFCVDFSEPARLLSVGYEAEIRRTSSLGRGALSHFFSCVAGSEASEP